MFGSKAFICLGLGMLFAFSRLAAQPSQPLLTFKRLPDQIISVQHAWPLVVQDGQEALTFLVVGSWAASSLELTNLDVDGLHAVVRPDVPIGGYQIVETGAGTGGDHGRIGCLMADATAHIPGDKKGAAERYNNNALICLVDADSDGSFENAIPVDTKLRGRPSVNIKAIHYKVLTTAPRAQTLQYTYVARSAGGGRLYLSVKLAPLQYKIAARDIYLGDPETRKALPQIVKIKPGDQAIALGPITIPIEAPYGVPELRITGLGNFAPQTIHTSRSD